MVGAISVPGVTEAQACPQVKESAGEPPPRGHWHVRISLIGLCLIFTDDSHSAPPPPPPPNTPTDKYSHAPSPNLMAEL